MSALISHLKHYRQQAGLTQAALAERVGVSRKTVNTVENQVFIPSTLLALKFAQELQVPVESLFEIGPSPQDNPLRSARAALKR